MQLAQVKADAKKKPTPQEPLIAPPGSDVYVAQRGDSIPSVARKHLKRTKYLTSAELAEAIRAANHNREGIFLKSGEQIIIPGILGAAIVEKTVPVARDFEVRAIYLTGVMAGSDHGVRIIRHWKEVGGNAVVFDIKDSDGIVNSLRQSISHRDNAYIPDLPKFVHFLHSENMHAIARIAIFRDEHLVTTHPELAVKSHKTGQPWRENGKLVWTDPSNPKVQDYDIALAKFVAQSGVDEVQFDYVRFPAEGDQKDAGFNFQNGQPDRGRQRRPPCNSAPTSITPSASAPQKRARPELKRLLSRKSSVPRSREPAGAALRSHCRLPKPRLRPASSHGRSAFARCLWGHGMAAPCRPRSHRAGHRSHG